MPAILKKYILILAGVAVSAGAYAFWPHVTPPPKMTMIPSIFASKGMGDKVLQVKMHFDEVKTDAESTSVYADFTLPFDFEGQLNYRFKLGEGVAVESGELTGTVNSLKANKAHSIVLKVKGFSKQQNHHVAFEIFGSKNGRKIYGDALLASDLENTFENTVQNVEKIKASGASE